MRGLNYGVKLGFPLDWVLNAVLMEFAIMAQLFVSLCWCPIRKRIL